MGKILQHSEQIQQLDEMQQTKQQISRQKINDVAFVIDIDGTLTLNNKQLPQSSQCLNLLNSRCIPYVLLTNNISHSQSQMSQRLNNILTLNSRIKSQQIILNYTPIKEIIKWKEIIVLIVGRQNRLNQILPLQFLGRYVTVDEYCTMFPEIVPLARRVKGQHMYNMRKEIERRLNIQNITKQTLQFGAILILTSPLNWQQSYQVIIDLLNSAVGSYPTSKTYIRPSFCIPIVSTVNDLFFQSSQCNLARILIQPFLSGLQSLYQTIYNHKLQILKYGKPQRKTFQFTQQYCRILFGKIKRFVMVGDSLQTDIVGADKVGWETIFVRTGVDKHYTQTPTINANNILQGVKKYLQLQNISIQNQHNSQIQQY